jgi:Zinc carboxypeptidase
MKKVFFLFLIISSLPVSAQEIQAPLQKNSYSKPTSYEELSAYVHQLDLRSKILNVEVIGQSAKGHNLYAMKFSSSEFGKDSSKIKILLFAQQHGNEQSGKEGALLLAQELLKPENQYLFDYIDLVVVPQMNPDGSEINKRLNGNEADLNRNHLTLTEPETVALHHLFDRYLFEVTMDVHEYYPFGDTWKKFGYRDNTDEFIGPVNNPNVSGNIKDLSNQSFLPFMKKYLGDRHFTSFIYSPGGPPGINYIRHSTFDINDGRQSFGILNSFSFIQEGMNGKDSFADNIKHRTEGQMTGMRGLLEYAYRNKEEIKNMVSYDRKQLIHSSSGNLISIQCEHVRNGEKLELPVHSYSSDNDTVISVVDYRPVVKSIYDVTRPEGYLIPKKLKDVTDWIDRQALKKTSLNITSSYAIEQYQIEAIDSIDFEGDNIVNPTVVSKDVKSDFSPEDYIYIPTAQLKGNMLVIALEPRSMLGLVTYKQFAYLLKAGEKYPILRVVKRQ